MEIVCAVDTPLASTTVNVYGPAHKPVRSSAVAPLLQEYIYGGTPPVTVASASPIQTPLHWISTVVIVRIIAPGSTTVTQAVVTHPVTASVTVTQ